MVDLPYYEKVLSSRIRTLFWNSWNFLKITSLGGFGNGGRKLLKSSSLCIPNLIRTWKKRISGLQLSQMHVTLPKFCWSVTDISDRWEYLSMDNILKTSLGAPKRTIEVSSGTLSSETRKTHFSILVLIFVRIMLLDLLYIFLVGRIERLHAFGKVVTQKFFFFRF